MSERKVNRRTVLKAATALAVTSLVSGPLLAQLGSGGNPKASRSAKELPGRGEFVIRGATVLTMDARIGDFARGDMHVRDGAIVAVAGKINAPTASSIDARGMICMPGFIDTHWHLWTSVCRPIIRIDDPKLGYFPVTNRLGPRFTLEDSYRSVRLGLSEALSAGATTVHNWEHHIVTPDHADAELRAMRDMGLRGRLAYPSSWIPPVLCGSLRH